MLLYLDNCCFNRPYDNQSHLLVRLETEAKLHILGLRQKDASHMACAILANVDCFITVDKKILNKPVLGTEILNPIDFLRRHCDV